MFFTESLTQSEVYGYMRTDNRHSDLSFSELQHQKDLRIVVKENDIHHDIAKEHFPHARIVRLPQLAPIGTEVEYIINNQADIAFWDDQLTQDFCEKNNYSYNNLHKVDHNNKSIKMYQNCMALPR